MFIFSEETRRDVEEEEGILRTNSITYIQRNNELSNEDGNSMDEFVLIWTV